MHSHNISLEDIKIRTDLRRADLDHVADRHAVIYAEELQFGPSFDAYVRDGINEFYQNYDPKRDRAWICEHGDQIVGFIVLMHRPEKAAQLRYFYLEKAYRGIGLGTKLMNLFMDFYHAHGYQAAYLYTVSELSAAGGLYKKYGFRLAESRPSTDFGKSVILQRYDL